MPRAAACGQQKPQRRDGLYRASTAAAQQSLLRFATPLLSTRYRALPARCLQLDRGVVLALGERRDDRHTGEAQVRRLKRDGDLASEACTELKVEERVKSAREVLGEEVGGSA